MKRRDFLAASFNRIDASILMGDVPIRLVNRSENADRDILEDLQDP